MTLENTTEKHASGTEIGGKEALRLRSQVTALEELLAVQEQVVQDRSDRLEEAMDGLKGYAQRLEEQQTLLQTQQMELITTNARLSEANASLAEVNLRLHRLATTDGLTGLQNHRAFQEQLAAEAERSRRYRRPLSLVLLDVDRFKQYNDTFGHPAGDNVLRRVAQVMCAATRTSDVVARYGGEEFVVVLPETDVPQSLAAAEHLRAEIENAGWVERAITVSLGVATYAAETRDPATLIANADAALYHSKRLGRNRVIHSRSLQEGSLASGINNAETIQPLVQTQHTSLTAVETSLQETLMQGYDAAVAGWSAALDMRDHETEGHSRRVTERTVCLAKLTGMTPEEVLYTRWGALLHDIGKLGIPDAILLKPGPLTEAEWTIMQRHPSIAYEMLRPIAFLRPALDIPYCHHEKWDGSGYPRGLRGEEIPLSVRLFTVVDIWDALSTDRPYRRAWPAEQVREHLRALSGTQFDPRAVEMFFQVFSCTTPTAAHDAQARRAA